MARPTKLTDKHIKDVEEAMRLGLTYALASGYVGVSESTFYAWLSKGQTKPRSNYGRFREALKRGQSKAAALSLARIQRAANNGSWQADAWLLERRFGYRKDADLHISDREEQDTATEHQANEELASVLSLLSGGG
jgi:hypothetical protein